MNSGAASGLGSNPVWQCPILSA